MPFQFVSHTGDIRVRLTAATLSGLFEAAAEAFTEVLTDRSTVAPARTEHVLLSSPDVESLIVEWLNELLYRFETQGLLVHHAAVEIQSHDADVSLDATLWGEAYNPERHAIKVLVKAVTYHGLVVTRSAGACEATVVLDI